MTLAQRRVLDKVSPVPEAGCWLWTGATWAHGRPQLRVADKLVLASRFAYEAFVGPIPCGMHVCHKCDTPLCVNPDHLFVGAHADNMRDRNKKGRQARLRGESNGHARLSEADVLAIKSLYAKGVASTEAIGREFGVSGRQVRYILRGKAWAHLAVERAA